MRKILSPLLAASIAFSASGAMGQAIPAAAQQHLDAARALAAQEKGWRHPGLVNCYPHDGLPSQAVNRDPLPTKVFDNLYYLGNGQFGPWAINTSEGIILIDSMNNQFDVDKYIIPGLITVGLDPKRLKVLIISHGHGDHTGGGRYLQDKYHLKVYETEADYDWTDMTSANRTVERGTGSPPKRDQVVKDGDTITLGDEAIKAYISPGHTPGSLSMLIPVKENGRPKLLAYFGGITSGGLSPRLHEAFDHSYTRLEKLVTDAKIDGYIAPHPNYDDAVYKIGYIALNPDQPNPFLIGAPETVLFLKVVQQCNLYNAALEAAGVHMGFEPRQPPDSLVKEPQ
jgi:metallo-beta-lactamase class B